MMPSQIAKGTSASTILVLCAISVLLLLVPAGAYAGLVLAALTAFVVASRPDLRRRPELLAVTAIALGTTGFWVFSQITGSARIPEWFGLS